MPVEHWMQFSTFAEQDFFTYPKQETYEGIVLNANMVVHASNGIASFLLEKRFVNTKYVVDPMTHAFQHDPSFICNSENKPKASIQKLSEMYGGPVERSVGRRPLDTSDFSLDGAVSDFSDKVIGFQENYLFSYMEKSDSFKYLDENDVQALRPYALFSPYFYLTELDYQDLGNLNLRFSIASRESVNSLGEGKKLFAMCVVSQGVISDSNIRDEVIALYKEMPVDGYVIWIDGLNERTASGTELRGLLELCYGLRCEGGKEVINLHGGFFSIMAGSGLGMDSLSGVCHGPEFGESRGVVPVGGGIPIARYYLPDIHSREKYKDVVGIISSAGWLESSEVFHEQVCSCDECKKVLNGDPDNFYWFGDSDAKSIRRKTGVVRIDFPTTETKKRCLRHYLECKNREYRAVNSMKAADLNADLDRKIEKWRQVAGPNFVAHLQLWKKVLNDFSAGVFD